jgi:TonB-linked SusC/RagA family outer membrane protein
MKMTILLLLAGTGVSYADATLSQNNNAVSNRILEVQDSRIIITGVVKDPDGAPLIGVTVVPQKGGGGSITGPRGEYSVSVQNMSETLIFSYVGMKEQTINLRDGVTKYDVVMEYTSGQIDAVVVEAGIIQRDKVGFTGSYNQISGEELKQVGSINVLQSLRSLDPSFNVTPNALRGSDPNTMAHISLRGGSTMNVTSTFNDYEVNPNEPLFILDGIETSLTEINDININRIESITILKDAGSTAIYGSRGGNGVVIVETVKPKAGQLRLTYDGKMQLSAADLSQYNLMNAPEKLAFEVIAGRYGDLNNWIANSDRIATFNSRLENIRQGVDTYWLKVPLRTGLSQDHSLNIDGGEGNMLYQVGISFKNVEGVMKGSSRQTFGGNVKLQYRKNNKLNVTNSLSLMSTNADQDSFAQEGFASFVNANPYFRMINEDGTIPKYLDHVTGGLTYDENGQYKYEARDFANPYYNALLDSRTAGKDFLLRNNTFLTWYILPRLQWTNTLSLGLTRVNSVTVKDPRHTSFEGVDYTQQGTYQSKNSREWSYKLISRISYNASIKDVHNLGIIGYASANSLQSSGDGYSANGFPKGVPVIPSYAYGYVEGSRPIYSESETREVNFLASFTYNYKLRYLFDFNLSHDGSTAFGQNNKFQTFWSAGLGWNVDKENFAKDWTWLDYLKIRGSYGINGNQNVSNISTNVYSYYPGNDIFGAAAYLSQFANPNLRWQVVAKSSAGFDLTTHKNRFNLTFDVYKTKTDPQIVSIGPKPSTGVSSYPVNLGYLEIQGLEFMASYQLIRDTRRDINLTLRASGASNRSTYGGFAESLNNLNESYKNQTGIDPKLTPNSLIQYRDGNSKDDLWAVRSLGIDPATGREIFLDRFGSPTFDYSPDDRVVIANRNPDLEGVLGFSLTVKNLTANFNFRYSFGGYDFNSDLHNRVENINSTTVAYNQDRRALYDRWAQPGDIARFKGIQIITSGNSQTPISSRFIQRNNFFTGESAMLSYSFRDENWLKSIGMNYLTLNLSYIDMFYLSTMKRERATNYPFARQVTFGISAQF